MAQLYIATAAMCLAAVLFLESLAPLHPAEVPLRRWAHNAALSVLSVLSVGTVLATPLLFWAAEGALGLRPGAGWLARWGPMRRCLPPTGVRQKGCSPS